MTTNKAASAKTAASPRAAAKTAASHQTAAAKQQQKKKKSPKKAKRAATTATTTTTAAAATATAEQRVTVPWAEDTQKTMLTAMRSLTDPRLVHGDGPPRPGNYVYGIVGSRDPLRFGCIGIGESPTDVRSIHHGGLAAVVSDTLLEVVDPSRDNVLAHERVNQAVMREHTLIPMSFGTVLPTREDIVALLRTGSDAFHDALAKMEGKLEFGLKVLWEPAAVVCDIELNDENIRHLKSQISPEKGATCSARIQYNRRLEALLEEHSRRYVNEIFSTLRDVCVASRANKPIGERMIVNGAFLVAREREAEFDDRVRTIGAQFDKLTFKYTGPWPPYNFVNLRLKLERSQENQPA